MVDDLWHSNDVNEAIVAGTPMVVKSKLSFLKQNAEGDSSAAQELAKFGFPTLSMSSSEKHP